MDAQEVVDWLRSASTEETRESLTRYGIPNERAFGVPMGVLKQHAKAIGTSHQLAAELWETGFYEARTLAAFIDDPTRVSRTQMDRWAHDFDSWAICDTVCFHLFDKTAHAWEKVEAWEDSREEFVRRASYALLWALSVHDKNADDNRFIRALQMLEHAKPDDRPLVNKAIDMALRAVGKRNAMLHQAALDVAARMSQAPEKSRAWIGRHALRELAK
jgi:3-methyladenine DNA glycosylase AlkD